MNIVIPMAGLGMRFKSEGYDIPKFLIDVSGKPMIERSIESFSVKGAQFIFITLGVDGTTRDLLETISVNPIIVNILEVTNGPAISCLMAKEYINSDEELLIANCDQILFWDFDNFLHYARNPKIDGVVVTYESDTPKNSYAKLNNRGRVLEIREKEVISNVSLNGVHYWKHGEYFVESALKMIENRDTAPNGEYYVGPTYNYLVDNKYITNYHISKEQHHAVGVPDDLQKFLEVYNGSI